MNLMNLTAVELGKKIKNKEVTVEEACKDAISRMNTMEGQVHSYVTVLEEEAILARAKEVQKAEKARTAGGDPVAVLPELQKTLI